MSPFGDNVCTWIRFACDKPRETECLITNVTADCYVGRYSCGVRFLSLLKNTFCTTFKRYAGWRRYVKVPYFSINGNPVSLGTSSVLCTVAWPPKKYLFIITTPRHDLKRFYFRWQRFVNQDNVTLVDTRCTRKVNHVLGFKLMIRYRFFSLFMNLFRTIPKGATQRVVTHKYSNGNNV